MPHEVGLRPSLENPLGCLFILSFLSGYHLHNRQGKPHRSGLRFLLGKCLDGNSIPMRKGVGNHFKFLTINAYPLGLCVAHSLELIADFVEFYGLQAGRQKMGSHSVHIVSDKAGRRLASRSQLCVTH